MSSLSNQQINQSYQGLIKLANSTSGITSSLQSLQDGLGNDTGLLLGTDYLDSPSQLTFQPLGRSKGGTSIAGSGAGTANTNVNKLNGHFFLAQRGETYTGLTVSVGTVASGDDSLEFAIYTVGRSEQYGLTPKDLLMSGMTLSTAQLSGTGFVTMTLPSPLTFPESGVYFLANLVQSSGTPAVRLRSVTLSTILQQTSILLSQMYGTVLGTSSSAYTNPFYGVDNALTTYVLYGGTDGPFASSYDPDTVGGTASSFSSSFGFILDK